MKLKYLFLLSIFFIVFAAPSFSQTCHTYSCNCKTESKTVFSPWVEWKQTNIILSRTPIYERICGYSTVCIEKNVYYTTQKEDRWIRIFGWTHHYTVTVRIRQEVCEKSISIKKCVKKLKRYEYNYLTIPILHFFKTESRTVCEQCRKCEDDSPPPPPQPVEDGSDDGGKKTELESPKLDIYDVSLGNEREFGKEIDVNFSLRNCYGNVKYTVEGCGDKKSGTAVCGSNNVKIGLKKEGNCNIKLTVEDMNEVQSKDLGSIKVTKTITPPPPTTNIQCKGIRVENVNIEFNSGGWFEFWKGKRSTITFNLNCAGTAQYKIDLCGDVRSGTTKCGNQKFDFNTKGGCIIHLWSKNSCSEVDNDIAYISKEYDYMIKNETTFEGTTVFVNNSIVRLYPSEGEKFVDDLEDGVYDTEINKLYSKGLSDKAIYLFLATSVFGSAALLSKNNRKIIVDDINAKIDLLKRREKEYNKKYMIYASQMPNPFLFPNPLSLLTSWDIKGKAIGLFLYLIDTSSNKYFNWIKRDKVIKKYDLPDPRLQDPEEIKNYLKKLSKDYYNNVFISKSKEFAQERYYSYLDLINHDLVFVGDAIKREVGSKDIVEFFKSLAKELLSLKTIIAIGVTYLVGFLAEKLVYSLMGILLTAISSEAIVMVLIIMAALGLIISAVDLIKKFNQILNNIKNLAIIADLIGKDNEIYKAELEKLKDNSYGFIIDLLISIPAFKDVKRFGSEKDYYINTLNTYRTINYVDNINYGTTNNEELMNQLPMLEEFDKLSINNNAEENGEFISREMSLMYKNFGIKDINTELNIINEGDNGAFSYDKDIMFQIKVSNREKEYVSMWHEWGHAFADKPLANDADLITKRWLNSEEYAAMHKMLEQHIDKSDEYIYEIFSNAAKKASEIDISFREEKIDMEFKRRLKKVGIDLDEIKKKVKRDLSHYDSDFDEYDPNFVGEYEISVNREINKKLNQVINKMGEEKVKEILGGFDAEDIKIDIENNIDTIKNEINIQEEIAKEFGSEGLSKPEDIVRQYFNDLDSHKINEALHPIDKKEIYKQNHIKEMITSIKKATDSINSRIKEDGLTTDYAVAEVLKKDPQLPIELGLVKFMAEESGDIEAIDSVKKLYNLFEKAQEIDSNTFTIEDKKITEIVDETYNFAKEYMSNNNFNLQSTVNEVCGELSKSPKYLTYLTGKYMADQWTSIESPTNNSFNELTYRNQKMIGEESKGIIPISFFKE